MITNPQEFKDKLLEIQNNTNIALVYLPSDEPRFIIDANSRAITIPGEFGFLSLKKDHNAETIYFEIDRYFDGEDLSQHTCVVQYKRSDKEGVYAVKSYDIESVDGKIIFGWTITNEVTLTSGDIEFSVRFYSIKDNKYVYNFNTLPAKSKILETLDIGSYPYEDIPAADYEIYIEKVNALEDTIITKADMQNEAGGFAGGKSAKAQDTNGSSINSVQLGEGTNPNAKTLQVYDYQLMDAEGYIPKERLEHLNVGYVTPEMFGAVGDGVVDDSVAFRKCVSFANENKNTIKLNKSYLLSGDIKVSCNVIGDHASIVGINRLWIEGNNLNVSGIAFKDCETNALFIHDSKNICISNCEINSRGFGIAIECSSDVTLTNIISNQSFDDNSNDFIHLYRGCKNINITNCIGTANDDFIAINAIETSGENTAITEFNICNVSIANIKATAYSAIRFYTNGTRTINNVCVKDCNFITNTLHSVRFTNDRGSGISTNSQAIIKNIEFHNVKIESQASSMYAINMNYCDVENILFENCYLSALSSVIRFSERCNGNITFYNCVLDRGANDINAITFYSTCAVDANVDKCIVRGNSLTPAIQMHATVNDSSLTVQNMEYTYSPLVYVSGGFKSLVANNIKLGTNKCISIGGTPLNDESLILTNITCGDVAPITLRNNRNNLKISCSNVNCAHKTNLQGDENYEGIRFVSGVVTARQPTISVKGDSYISLTDSQFYGFKMYNGSNWVTLSIDGHTHPASMITGFSDAVKSCTDSIVAETGELPVSGSAVADIANSLVSISGDYVIDPVIDDITEKFTLKASWVMMAYSMVTFSETSDMSISYNNMTYCLYAGETSLTTSPLGVGESTTSASGAFEGNNITIRFYLGETEVFRAKLNTINIFGKKLGRLERI